MIINREVKCVPPPSIVFANPNVKKWDNGLILHEEFITCDEEAAAIEAIEADTRWTGIGKRQTLQFGHHFDYTTFGASETDTTPLPPYLASLLSRLPLIPENMLRDDGSTEKQLFTPDQFTVQYYPPGTGIPPHVDTHSAFREALYSLSLGSAVAMTFKKCGKTEARRMRKPKRSLLGASSGSARTHSVQISTSSPPHEIAHALPTKEFDGGNENINHNHLWDELEEEEPWEVLLPQRSLLIMTGPSRYGYIHKILGRKSDMRKDGSVVEREGRYSITMRTVVKDGTPCRCEFPHVCDSRVKRETSEAQSASTGQTT